MPTHGEQWHHQFIHNVFGSFIQNTLEFFSNALYPRYKHTVVGTYDKAVEYITKQEKLGKEEDKPNLPALILNPSGDFNIDDANSAGAKQLWRFPNLAPGLAHYLYEPLYQDNNVTIAIGFTRIKGELELMSLLPSFYEYFDLKIFFLQFFGGEGRIIEPINYDNFLIIPPELYNYEYSNDVTGQTHKLDWESAGIYEQLVKTTNQNEMVVGGKTKPRFILRSLNDSSERHGGLDSLAEWKLSAIVEYELEVPSFLTMKTDWVVENINFEIRAGFAYSVYENYNLPVHRETIETHWDSGLAEDSNTDFDLPEEPDEVTRRSIILKNRYFHELTEDELSKENFIITLPEGEQIFDQSLIKVNSRLGELKYGKDFKLHNKGTELRIKKHSSMRVGDLIEMYIYDSAVGSYSPVKMMGGTAAMSTTGSTPNRASLNVKWAFTGTAVIETEISEPTI